MNLKNSLLSCLLSMCALSTTAQLWSGTNPLYTNSNVGIGFATSPTLIDKLVLNGSFRIMGAGTLSYRPTTNSDGGSDYLVISGQNSQEYGGGIELKGGKGTSGGYINILGGNSDSKYDGGNVTIDGGSGVNPGHLLLQSFSNGRIGIGTNNPTEKLHVVGNSLFDGSLNINYGGKISRLGSSDIATSLVFSGLDVGGTFTTNDEVQSANSVTIKGGDAIGVSGVGGFGGNLYLYGGYSNSSAPGTNIYIESGSGNKAGHIILQAYQGASGSVLLGVREPIANTKFAVSGNSFFEGNIQIGSLNPKPLSILEVGKASKTYFTDEAAQIGIGWNAYKEGTTWKYSNANTPVSRIGQFENGFNIGIAKTGTIGATVTWTSVLQATYSSSNILETRIGNLDSQIFMDGYVSIGGILSAKMPTGYSLAVAKGILTEKVKIATVASAEWKDFVFDKGYKLRPLQEVESFIKDNKHLPEVPSSSDVEQNGYELVKMDATLLQKLEEMTLYVIELQKRIKILEEGK